MRRLITFTLAVEIDESTFGVEPALAAQEQQDFDEIILPDIAVSIGREAVRVLQFHADEPKVAATSVTMSEAYDPALEPF